MIEMPIYSSGVGYGIVVGVGAGFAFIMVGISWLLSRYMSEIQDSEMQMTAKRSIGAGLVASAVVSSWTIGATLLLSCTMAFTYGIAAPWWYGAGACVQIIIFATVAIELKRKAPNCHTFQEAVRIRYGAPAHILMCVYSLIQQITASANLLINGSSVFASLTGANRDACIVLLPIGVLIYTMLGGIKATFVTDWMHTIVIYFCMLMFLFIVYVTSEHIGSPGALWELLVEAAEASPVPQNQDGSYLTMTSVQAGLFGLVVIGSGFSYTVDSALFQKAIAANPVSTFGGYVLGGVCWFTIPFCLASTLGLAAAGLQRTPAFVTYPDLMTAEEIDAGLVMPYAAVSLMGRGGAGAVLVMVFMAATSAFSSEAVAVSALATYDGYQAYFNPNASGKTLVKVGHIAVASFGVFVVALAIGLAHAGFSVAFITTVAGIVVGPCIVPMILTITWRKMSSLSFCLSTTISTAAALALWIGYTHKQSGVVTLATLSTNEALAAGNMFAVCLPLVLTPFIAFLKPDDFDFQAWKEIKQNDDSEFDKAHGAEKVLTVEELTARTVAIAEDKKVKVARNRALVVSTVFVLFFLLLFPMPLYGSKYVFSKSFFTGWIVVVFIWAFFATTVITLLPLWGGRKQIPMIFKKLILDIQGKDYRHVGKENSDEVSEVSDASDVEMVTETVQAKV